MENPYCGCELTRVRRPRSATSSRSRMSRRWWAAPHEPQPAPLISAVCPVVLLATVLSACGLSPAARSSASLPAAAAAAAPPAGCRPATPTGSALHRVAPVPPVCVPSLLSTLDVTSASRLFHRLVRLHRPISIPAHTASGLSWFQALIQHGLSSKKMALITSNDAVMCSLRIKWP